MNSDKICLFRLGVVLGDALEWASGSQFTNRKWMESFKDAGLERELSNGAVGREGERSDSFSGTKVLTIFRCAPWRFTCSVLLSSNSLPHILFQRLLRSSSGKTFNNGPLILFLNIWHLTFYWTKPIFIGTYPFFLPPSLYYWRNNHILVYKRVHSNAWKITVFHV